jgi:3-isopropylmalate dehydratase small subunit
MEPFTTLTGAAAPLLEDDVNTDQITPTFRNLDPNYAELFFARRRRRDDGEEVADFVFNRPAYRQAKILVTGANFGCGSSREGAVWAVLAFGVRCIIARSFSDTYRLNCLKNGILPISLEGPEVEEFEQLVVEVDGREPMTVDLGSETIEISGRTFSFSIPEGERQALLKGLDDIGYTLEYDAAITRFEQAESTATPWLQHLAVH